MIPAWVNSKSGAVYLNDLKRYVKGTFLVPAAAVTPLIIPAAASATVPSVSPPVVVESSPDAVSEIFSMFAEQDAGTNADVQARMTVQITDTAFRRRLMDQPILCTHVFGGGGVNGSGGIAGSLPLFLRETILLEQQQTLEFGFSNNSVAGSTSFRFGMEGRKFQSTSLSRQQVSDYINQERFRKTLLNPYWLSTDMMPNTINPGAVQTVFITNAADTFFVVFGIVATFILNNPDAAGGDIVEGFTVQFFDAKTQRPLQNQPVARSCCTGSAGLPFQLPTGLIMEPNTKMQMNLTSLVTGSTIDAFITFIGVKSYVADNPFEVPKVGVAYPSPASVGVP